MITKQINGFRVIFKKMESPIATTRIVINCGSINEGVMFARGTAHYLEHLAFKDEEFAKKYSSIGEFNAYTCTSRTVYYANYAKKNFAKATKLLCNMVLNLGITEEMVENERNIILEEFYPSICEPVSKFNHLKELLVWGNEYYDTIGDKDSINKIDAGSLSLFRKYFYAKNNIAIIICGDIDIGKIEKTIEAATKNNLEDFAVSEVITNRIVPDRKNVHIEHETDQAIVSLDFPNMNRLDLSSKTNRAVTRIFATIFSSCVFQHSITHSIIKEKLGLCYEIGGYNIRRKGLNYFSVFAKTSVGNITKLKNEILKQLMIIKKEGVSKELLKMAKENAEYFTLESSIGVQNYAFNYLDAIFYNNGETPEENLRYDRRVTNQQIKKYASILLEHENYIFTKLC